MEEKVEQRLNNQPHPNSNKLLLEVVTPTNIEVNREVDFVVVPTIKGPNGIFPRHVRLMTALDTGVLHYTVDGETHYMAVSEGFVEVTPHRVLVLAEAADLPENIDVEQALAEKRKAEEELKLPLMEKISFAKTQVELQRAITKLQVAKKYAHTDDKK